MSLRYQSIIHTDNISLLGKFCCHHAKSDRSNKGLIPIFKVEPLEKVNQQITYRLIPGYLDQENQFYDCPLQVFNVQIEKYIQEEDEHEQVIAIHSYLRIFSLDFTKNRKIQLTFENTYNLDITRFNSMINCINEYIASGFDISLLTLNGILERNCFDLVDRSIIIKAVDELRFDFYGRSQYRPGNDNYFWEECQIRNLPSDRYLIDLIQKNIKSQCEHVNVESYGLLIRFKMELAYAGYYDTTNGEDSTQREKRIKDILKLDIAKEFDAKTQLFYRISLADNNPH